MEQQPAKKQNMFELTFLIAAGFFAGLIDSIAGGGGLISLPALLAAGVPSHLALGTNKLQSMCGTTFAIANFHRKSKVIWKIAAVGIPVALLGSVFGARLTLFISQSILAKILIATLPPAAVLMFFSKGLIRKSGNKSSSCKGGDFNGINFWIITPLTCFIIGLYDGFFGPGTGTFLIVGLVLFSRLSLVNASATAKTFNLASNVGAFATFAISGNVNFAIGGAMAIANIAGNLLGSHFAMKHGNEFVNKVVYVSLGLLFAYLLVKYF